MMTKKTIYDIPMIVLSSFPPRYSETSKISLEANDLSNLFINKAKTTAIIVIYIVFRKRPVDALFKKLFGIFSIS